MSLILYSNVGWVVLREPPEFSREFSVEGGDTNKSLPVLAYSSTVFTHGVGKVNVGIVGVIMVVLDPVLVEGDEDVVVRGGSPFPPTEEGVNEIVAGVKPAAAVVPGES